MITAELNRVIVELPHLHQPGVQYSISSLTGRMNVQVITAELNKVVVELLQSLLYWQERARALHPAKAKQKKRLVSGLRSASHSASAALLPP